jgi:hypothetical protein
MQTTLKGQETAKTTEKEAAAQQKTELILD